MEELRLKKLQEHIKKESAWFAFITSKENVFYLTGLLANPHERLIALFVLENDYYLVIPKMEQEVVRDAGYSDELVTYSDHENVWDLIKSRLEKSTHASSKVLIEQRTVSYERVLELDKLSDSLEFIDCEPVMMSQRLIKTEVELETLQRAAAFADVGVEFGINALKTGVTELEVIAEIEYQLKKQGIREMSFQTTVLFGDHAASPHGKPGDRALQEGEFVLFDLGVVLDGYCSDITRTVAYGEVNDQAKAIYEVVLDAQNAALHAAKPGIIIGDLDLTARTVISEAGFGDYFPHRLGHGLGIDVHEAPSMSQENKDTLQLGMTFTIEPGIYVPNVAGVRIEDDVVVTEDGGVPLTIFPKTLLTIPPTS
ncbi:M24 family metallopeptidase [Shouchella patagoniensis]|uniref:M24 family metallopeptidase n=1 Tax=Shouchella patagoniensis TaxID=228576 RepID=UPI000994E523|nr:Xaa-Pro peptidase family protein [Shouchella patagoniensis]